MRIAKGRDIITGRFSGESGVIGLVGMDKEKVIQEIIAALATLEKCTDQEVESVKKFLRWMSDDALQDMRDKYREALERERR